MSRAGKIFTQSKEMPNILKSIDTTPIIVNSIKLSARKRNKTSAETKPKATPMEILEEGIVRLSKPKPKAKIETNNRRIKKSALRYKATDRIQKLADPKTIPSKGKSKSSKRKTFPYNIPCANKRVEYLALPKYIVPKITELTPSASFQSNVSYNALNYVPTKRIKELATPKYYTIFEEKFGEWLEKEMAK